MFRLLQLLITVFFHCDIETKNNQCMFTGALTGVIAATYCLPTYFSVLVVLIYGVTCVLGLYKVNRTFIMKLIVDTSSRCVHFHKKEQKLPDTDISNMKTIDEFLLTRKRIIDLTITTKAVNLRSGHTVGSQKPTAFIPDTFQSWSFSWILDFRSVSVPCLINVRSWTKTVALSEWVPNKSRRLCHTAMYITWLLNIGAILTGISFVSFCYLTGCVRWLQWDSMGKLKYEVLRTQVYVKSNNSFLYSFLFSLFSFLFSLFSFLFSSFFFGPESTFFWNSLTVIQDRRICFFFPVLIRVGLVFMRTIGYASGHPDSVAYVWLQVLLFYRINPASSVIRSFCLSALSTHLSRGLYQLGQFRDQK